MIEREFPRERSYLSRSRPNSVQPWTPPPTPTTPNHHINTKIIVSSILKTKPKPNSGHQFAPPPSSTNNHQHNHIKSCDRKQVYGYGCPLPTVQTPSNQLRSSSSSKHSTAKTHRRPLSLPSRSDRFSSSFIPEFNSIGEFWASCGKISENSFQFSNIIYVRSDIQSRKKSLEKDSLSTRFWNQRIKATDFRRFPRFLSTSITIRKPYIKKHISRDCRHRQKLQIKTTNIYGTEQLEIAFKSGFLDEVSNVEVNFDPSQKGILDQDEVSALIGDDVMELDNVISGDDKILSKKIDGEKGKNNDHVLFGRIRRQSISSALQLEIDERGPFKVYESDLVDTIIVAFIPVTEDTVGNHPLYSQRLSNRVFNYSIVQFDIGKFNNRSFGFGLNGGLGSLVWLKKKERDGQPVGNSVAVVELGKSINNEDHVMRLHDRSVEDGNHGVRNISCYTGQKIKSRAVEFRRESIAMKVYGSFGSFYANLCFDSILKIGREWGTLWKMKDLRTTTWMENGEQDRFRRRSSKTPDVDWLVKSKSFGLAEDNELGVVTRIACGAVVGIVGQTVAYSIDVIRKQMPLVGLKNASSIITGDGRGKAPLEYTGMIDARRGPSSVQGFTIFKLSTVYLYMFVLLFRDYFGFYSLYCITCV